MRRKIMPLLHLLRFWLRTAVRLAAEVRRHREMASRIGGTATSRWSVVLGEMSPSGRDATVVGCRPKVPRGCLNNGGCMDILQNRSAVSPPPNRVLPPEVVDTIGDAKVWRRGGGRRRLRLFEFDDCEMMMVKEGNTKGHLVGFGGRVEAVKVKRLGHWYLVGMEFEESREIARIIFQEPGDSHVGLSDEVE